MRRRTHIARGLLAALALGWVLVSPAVLAQQPAGGAESELAIEKGDFDTASDDWNGLTGLFVLARGLQIELVPHTTLDYAELEPTEPIFVLFPRTSLDVGSVERYVLDGGRVLLADDFGASADVLSRLDLSRIEPAVGTLPHDEFLNANPALPIVRSKGVHALLDGVDVVVANHPAILYNVGGPVLGYSEDGGLVYDMNLGEGKVVAVADSSIFINHMLTVGDNEQLARNMLEYACASKTPCRVHLYVGEFEESGRYGSGDSSLSDAMGDSVESFNEALHELMDSLPTEQLFYYLGVLFAAGLIVYLFTIFPVRATRPYSAYVSDTRERLSSPQSEFDWNLSRFDGASSGMNYALPVAILKEIFEEIFLRSVDAWEPEPGEPRPTVEALGERFAEIHLDMHEPERARRVRAQVVELLATLARVPTRHKVFLGSDVYFSERDLLRIHDRCMEVLELMGKREEYERRTRTDA